MYEVQPLTDEQKRHRIAFYQSALTLFANQGSNNAMMMKDQHQGSFMSVVKFVTDKH
jgi:hypothetical protein